MCASHLHSPRRCERQCGRGAPPLDLPSAETLAWSIVLMYDTHRDWRWWQGTLFENFNFLEQLQKALSGIVCGASGEDCFQIWGPNGS